jgi:single-strand DNA-binding protein
MSLNLAQVIGNLGADPELRYTSSGQAVCTLRLATDESYSDKEGNKKSNTQWHRVVVWGKQAEACKQYLGKGRQVYAQGRLQTRKWIDKDGVTRFTTEIVAQRIRFLGPANQSSAAVANESVEEDSHEEMTIEDTAEEMLAKIRTGDVAF